MDILGLIALAKSQSGENTDGGKIFHFKGIKSSVNLLPIQGEEGDVYKVEEDSYYAWDGNSWVDIGNILSVGEIEELISGLASDVSDLKSEINELAGLDGGTTGQVLRKKSNTDKDFEWASVAQPTDAQVDDWLTAHPEATTTVQDGAITIPKLAEDVVETIQPLMALSVSDGAANTALLTTLLANKNVKLKPGTYPLESSVIVDGHTLDLNGSKFVVSVFAAQPIFIMRGYSPCIKNGEIEGSYTDDAEAPGSGNQSCIEVQQSSDVLIKSLIIHGIWGRGINDSLRSQYGELVGFSSAESYLNGIHTTAIKSILPGYKWLRTVGGNGYNSAYVVEPVQYLFYDDSDTQVASITEIPSYPVEIPAGATKFALKVQTGKSGLTEGYIPFNVGFTNHNSFETVEDCLIYNCQQWGIANLFGEAHVRRTRVLQAFNRGVDIEDHQACRVFFEDCKITGNCYMNAFYASFSNCSIDGGSSYFGKLHNYENCTGRITLSKDRDFHRIPAICVIGGEMGINTDLSDGAPLAHRDIVAERSMLVSGGPLLFGRALNTTHVFGATNFLLRNQSLVKAEIAFCGITVGKYVYRCVSNLPQLYWATDPGSRVIIFANPETIGNQLSTYLAPSAGDCYGLIGMNCIVYPNGHKISDSIFTPVGSSGGNVAPNKISGTYTRCDFDAKNTNIIIASNSNAALTVVFNNCCFRNLQTNRLLREKATWNNPVTLTFNNCIFEDLSISSQQDVLDYICASLNNVAVTIDGTSYTA